MIFKKTKYLQQQKLLGSPDLCNVIYVGGEGGAEKGKSAVYNIYIICALITNHKETNKLKSYITGLYI